MHAAMIRAYLVDDEPYALRMLEQRLGEIGGVEVVGSSSDPARAYEDIVRLKPHAVFLDIEMPGVYGMRMATRIGEDLPGTSIVFVTAHSEYALAAFELEAVDYVLKPLDRERLRLTVQRLAAVRTNGEG